MPKTDFILNRFKDGLIHMDKSDEYGVVSQY